MTIPDQHHRNTAHGAPTDPRWILQSLSSSCRMLGIFSAYERAAFLPDIDALADELERRCRMEVPMSVEHIIELRRLLARLCADDIAESIADQTYAQVLKTLARLDNELSPADQA